MILISHRGNIDGIKKEKENTVKYIKKAIKNGFDVEIDTWYIENKIFLGHNFPKNKVNLSFLESYKNKLWIHCKNIEALYYLKDNYNCFFHSSDDAVLTSKNYIWTFPGRTLTNQSILLKFEKDDKFVIPKNIFGICSDNIKYYFKKLKNENSY